MMEFAIVVMAAGLVAISRMHRNALKMIDAGLEREKVLHGVIETWKENYETMKRLYQAEVSPSRTVTQPTIPEEQRP